MTRSNGKRPWQEPRGVRFVGLATALALAAGLPFPAAQPAAAADGGRRAVVVATVDTGTNPFHPCFRRPGHTHPKLRAPSYPAGSRALPLALEPTYEGSLARSRSALSKIRPWTLHHIPHTNLSFYGSGGAARELVDTYPHGAMASSQVACGGEFGLAPDTQLVVLNGFRDPSQLPRLIGWITAQPWIDVVHLNIQGTPLVIHDDAVARVNRSGKLVVIAAGNGAKGLGASYPMELSEYNAPPGSLIVGANDNGGYTPTSNLNPHVVMDGMATVAAAARHFDSTLFDGTSSSSPRVAGYAARLLTEARRRLGHRGGGLLVMPEGHRRPAAGPLRDGVLRASELHEVICKTANRNPHDSRYDGQPGPVLRPIPQPVDTPFANYVKMGYGEVSEHTLPLALRVLLGTASLPDRPAEDVFYSLSERARNAQPPR